MSALAQDIRRRTSGLRAGFAVLAVTLALAVVSMQVGGSTANADLSLMACVAFALIVGVLWRPGEPPVLLFALVYQWLQVAVETFHANVLGITLAQFMPWAPVEKATYVGLTSLVALSGGLAVGAGPVDSALYSEAREEATKIRISRLIQLSLGLLVVVEGLLSIGVGGGLYQIVAGVSQLRFAALFVLGFVTITQRRGVPWFALIVAFEVANSLGGFFAGFRTPIFVAFLAAATTLRQVTPPRLLATVLLAAGALYLGIVWQAIKVDYRDIASQGTGEQIVELDRSEQFEALSSLWADTNQDIASRGLDGLARRMAYVDFLAYTIQFVPGTRPHANGEVWFGALRHILVPRIVWPDKPELQPDTEFTREYTGLSLLSTRTTSISIGFVGDAYIDFGEPGMYGLLFVLGLALGRLYRLLLRLRRGFVVVRFGLVVATFLSLANFETSAAKLLGGLLSPWLIAFVGSWLFLHEICRWLVAVKASEED